MFQKLFVTELSFLTQDSSLIHDLLEEIKTLYAKPHRYYHTLNHLDFMIKELLQVKEEIIDWQVLVFAVAYHDIIYQPAKNNNEKQSAELACSRLSQLNLDETRKQKCVSQILATKSHQLNPDSDTNYLIDADLAILGADQETYLNYSKQVRKEYKLYPDFIYRPGRKRVLHHFLEMPCIFKTARFRDKYEIQARKNLETELSDLQRS